MVGGLKFRQERDCIIYVAKTDADQLIFVFTYAKSSLPHEVAQLSQKLVPFFQDLSSICMQKYSNMHVNIHMGVYLHICF